MTPRDKITEDPLALLTKINSQLHHLEMRWRNQILEASPRNRELGLLLARSIQATLSKLAKQIESSVIVTDAEP